MRKFLFILVVLALAVLGCEQTFVIYPDPEQDLKTPVPGGGGEVAYSRPAAEWILGWTAAFDEVTIRADLEYRIYHSKLPYSSDTVAAVQAEGTPVTDWTKAMTSWVMTGYTGGANFYTVLVRDEAGNTTCYIAADDFFIVT